MRAVAIVALSIMLPRLAVAEAPAPSEESPLLRALADELERGRTLELPGMPRPYYLAYAVLEYEQAVVSAEFGSRVESSRDRARFLRIELRVGSPKLDNTNLSHPESIFSRPVQLPIEDDYAAIRRALWLATDDAYKSALELLEKKRAADKVAKASPVWAGDFSPAPAAKTESVDAGAALDLPALEALVRSGSAALRELDELQEGEVRAASMGTRRIFVSSEGARSVDPGAFTRIEVLCRAQAEDGMVLREFGSLEASPGKLPTPEDIATLARETAQRLLVTRKAELADSYNGPILFEGRAAAQLVRALLAGELSGTPAPRGGDSRMASYFGMGDTHLEGRVGQQLLPRGFRLEDDPLRDSLAGQVLLGHYKVDDEGVPAAKVALVEDGKLLTLLMSRTPRRGIESSNGHGRAGFATHARGQLGNLILSSARGLSAADLKKSLLAEARRAGLDHAVIVRLLAEPGLAGPDGSARAGQDEDTLTAVLVASRVDLQGRETPLRGGLLGRMSLGALKEIVAAGNAPSVLGYLGGMLGSAFGPRPGGFKAMTAFGLPTAVASPSLLLKDVELRPSQDVRRLVPVIARPPASRP